MKLRNLFFAAAAFAGLFSACSNEMIDGTDNGQDQQTAEAYASFSFSMPAGSSTRAEGDVEVGTSSENNITEVYFLLYNKTNGNLAQDPEIRLRADFTPVTTGGVEVYTLLKDKNIGINAAGEYQVHVIVNPATEVNATTLGTLTKYNAYVEEVAAKKGLYCRKDQFMMTNAAGAVAANVTKANTKNNALAITIPVERLAAKLTITSKGVINFTDGTGSIEFNAYKVINTRNSAYGLRRVGTIQADAVIGALEADKYVVENNFDAKNVWSADLFENIYSRKLNTYVPFRVLGNGTTTATTDQHIAYCIENTMKERADLNKGYATAVILRGKVTMNNVIGQTPNTDGTFYKYEGKFYYTLSDIDAAKAGQDALNYEANKETYATKALYFTAISNKKAILSKLGVELFAQGNCYYYYWVRHNDDNKADAIGKMEHVIVRNNVYKMTINTVAGLGAFESGTPGAPNPDQPTVGQPDVDVDGNGGEVPNPEIPGTIAPDQEDTTPVIPVEPEDPIIDNDLYLNIQLTVNKWTIRSQSIDL